MPGSTPATSQLDWLSSTTAMIVLSWSKATRDLLKSFSWGIGALRQLFASDDGAISSPPAPYHLTGGGSRIRTLGPALHTHRFGAPSCRPRDGPVRQTEITRWRPGTQRSTPASAETVADANASDTFGVVRLLSTGGLDQTFGTGGSTRIAFTDFINTPNALALQGDGKIVVAGQAASADGTVSEFAVARFNANGTLDRGFRANGKVTT